MAPRAAWAEWAIWECNSPAHFAPTSLSRFRERVGVRADEGELKNPVSRKGVGVFLLRKSIAEISLMGTLCLGICR